MATHSSILAWIIPWMEEPDGLQSTGSQSWIRLSDFTFNLGGTQETAKVLVDNSIGLCFECVRGCSCCIKLQIYRLQPAERGSVNYPRGVSSSSPASELPPWGSENPWVPLIEHVLWGQTAAQCPTAMCHMSGHPRGCSSHLWPQCWARSSADVHLPSQRAQWEDAVYTTISFPLRKMPLSGYGQKVLVLDMAAHK